MIRSHSKSKLSESKNEASTRRLMNVIRQTAAKYENGALGKDEIKDIVDGCYQDLVTAFYK